ncbi:hypothetical protein EVAR_38715_1 [Eumeta japonica]|uniref:Uncharacterized protein n=1 Tax=Eumeta variegata TaxID=151549 RepID=A0A4C1XLA4_EUMVA|nr:hypothetical protein EVAR_38715_1 [Eumeta japonica]
MMFGDFSCFVRNLITYGGGVTSTLHTLHYEIFVRSAVNTKIHLARPPPLEEAAAQYAYQTYHQVQKWLEVDKDPINWGWTSNRQGLFPVIFVKDPAPQTLLQFISCNFCKGSNGRGCIWQKRAKVLCYPVISAICYAKISPQLKQMISTAKNISSLWRRFLNKSCVIKMINRDPQEKVVCGRFYSDASADSVLLVPRSRSHTWLKRNATISHAFSCVQPAFIDL